MPTTFRKPSAYKGKDISLAIPTRTRSNTLWNNKCRGILEMGDAKSTRELFNQLTAPSSSCRRASTAVRSRI